MFNELLVLIVALFYGEEQWINFLYFTELISNTSASVLDISSISFKNVYLFTVPGQ